MALGTTQSWLATLSGHSLETSGGLLADVLSDPGLGRAARVQAELGQTPTASTPTIDTALQSRADNTTSRDVIRC